MTNLEKFEEVFGVRHSEVPIGACFICPDDECKNTDCRNCRYKHWWQEEYTEGGADGDN